MLILSFSTRRARLGGLFGDGTGISSCRELTDNSIYTTALSMITTLVFGAANDRRMVQVDERIILRCLCEQSAEMRWIAKA